MKPLLSRSGALIAILALAPALSAQNAALEFDEIIVTGSPLTRSVDESLTGLSVLTLDELTLRSAATIGEVLKYEPGVSSTQFGAGASRPIIRGQGGDRVRVLNNGIGSIDASSSSPDHAVAAEPAQAERIEVMRGASLLRYGSSGSGGIVNVIDGRMPSEMPEDNFDGALRLGTSTVDRGYDVAGSTDVALSEAFVLHLDGTYRKAEDYDIPGYAESAYQMAFEEEEEHENEHDDDHEDEHEDEHDHEDEEEMFGRLDNSSLNTKSGTVGLSYIGDRGHIGVAFHEFRSEYGIPAGHHHHEEDEHHEDDDYDEDHEDDHDEDDHEDEEDVDVKIELEQTRFDLNASLNLEGFFEEIQFFGGYADYKHAEIEGEADDHDDEDHADEDEHDDHEDEDEHDHEDEGGTTFTNEGYELRAEAIQAERNGWRAAYGVSYRHRDFSAVGAEAFVDPTVTKQTALYTFQETDFGDIHLEGALRFEQTDHKNTVTGLSKDFTGVSLSAGGDVHLSDRTRLGGTVFRTERAPSTEELFADGAHLATNQYERGDAELDVETATGIELALRYRADGYFATANLFHTSYDDYIYEIETGEEIGELPVFQFVGNDATFTGFEVQGGTQLGTFEDFELSLDGLLSYVRAETDTDNLPRIPPLSGLIGLEANADWLRLRAELDYVADTTNLSHEELPTDGYVLANVFATWYAAGADEGLYITASAHNLLDEEARQHSSFLKDLLPLPGRNVKLSIGYRF